MNAHLVQYHGLYGRALTVGGMVCDKRLIGADPAPDVRDWFAGKIRRAVPEPAISLRTLLKFIAGLGAVLLLPPAGLIGLPATDLLNYSIAVVKYFAGLDRATSYATIGPFTAVISYGAIALASVYLRWATQARIDTSSLL